MMSGVSAVLIPSRDPSRFNRICLKVVCQAEFFDLLLAANHELITRRKKIFDMNVCLSISCQRE